MNLERAIAIAATAHVDQCDRAGAPYILHPMRVMLAMSGDAERIVAVLHDVVEDADVSLDDLRDAGFAPEIVRAIDALTKHDGEDYLSYVARAAADDLARKVKLADLQDNLDLTRMAAISEPGRLRAVRYRRAAALVRSIGRQHGDGPDFPELLPFVAPVSADSLEEDLPGSMPIFACDFHVTGAEDGELIPGGLSLGRIVNVDHHAPLPEMRRHVTSTELAMEWLAASGRVPAGSYVAVNHTDCDSMLSSALLSGLVEPEDRFVEAARAADHTGEENEIADLLQALDEERSGDRTAEEYRESLESLKLLLAGQQPRRRAQSALELRQYRREAASRAVTDGRVQRYGSLAFGTFDSEMDGAFFPALLPECSVIALASPYLSDARRWVVKVRLGNAAPEGMTLHQLRLREFDDSYGGRWNGGSTKRGGGSAHSPERWLDELQRRMRAHAGNVST